MIKSDIGHILFNINPENINILQGTFPIFRLGDMV